MVSLRLAIALMAGLVAYGQSGGLLDDTKAPVKGAAQEAAQPPSATISPEVRGDIFMARRMYREAIEAFGQASQKDPIIINKTGIAYHQLLQIDKAKKYYERALKLKPTYFEAQNNLGVIYYSQKSFRRAVNCYKKALRFSPDSASVLMNLGTAYFARKNYKEASGMYEKALAIDPNVFEHRGTYGTVLEERTVEERAKFHYYLAKLYAKDSRTDLALQYLRRALEEGFKDKKKLETDPEFQAMRELPEFKQLLTAEPRVL
ncbi:MAG: tetratricopeptide repeat protein [Acidobacteriia bacterium]|nr:tetratricopeptide repeat protein [Terriglobia bacterium]